MSGNDYPSLSKWMTEQRPGEHMRQRKVTLAEVMRNHGGRFGTAPFEQRVRTPNVLERAEENPDDSELTYEQWVERHYAKLGAGSSERGKEIAADSARRHLMGELNSMLAQEGIGTVGVPIGPLDAQDVRGRICLAPNRRTP